MSLHLFLYTVDVKSQDLNIQLLHYIKYNVESLKRYKQFIKFHLITSPKEITDKMINMGIDKFPALINSQSNDVVLGVDAIKKYFVDIQSPSYTSDNCDFKIYLDQISKEDISEKLDEGMTSKEVQATMQQIRSRHKNIKNVKIENDIQPVAPEPPKMTIEENIQTDASDDDRLLDDYFQRMGIIN